MNEREKSQKSAKVAVGNDLQMRRVLFEELRKWKRWMKQNEADRKEANEISQKADYSAGFICMKISY